MWALPSSSIRLVERAPVATEGGPQQEQRRAAFGGLRRAVFSPSPGPGAPRCCPRLRPVPCCFCFSRLLPNRACASARRVDGRRATRAPSPAFRARRASLFLPWRAFALRSHTSSSCRARARSRALPHRAFSRGSEPTSRRSAMSVPRLRASTPASVSRVSRRPTSD